MKACTRFTSGGESRVLKPEPDDRFDRREMTGFLKFSCSCGLRIRYHKTDDAAAALVSVHRRRVLEAAGYREAADEMDANDALERAERAG